MQIELLVGLTGLLLLGAVLVRGSAALATLAYYRIRDERQDRRVIKAFRTQATVFRGTIERTRTHSQPTHQPHQNSHQFPDKIKLVVAKRVTENAKGDICSFYLTSSDRSTLPQYLPGQFLTFSYAVPGIRSPVTRCYSLSMHPTNPQDFYRVSVKRLLPDTDMATRKLPGVGSNYFHDELHEGTIIEAMPPAGSFFLEQNSLRPIVLIAGGIGITPLLSMLDWLAAGQSTREVLIVYGARNSYEHAFRNHLQWIGQSLPNFNQIVFYSQPTTACQKGVDYHEVGHVNVNYMKHLLKGGDYEFYVCGPTPMMQSITQNLRSWGVPEDAIMSESFGVGTQPPSPTTAIASPPLDNADIQKVSVEFSRSKKKVLWTGRQGTLLELAEACGAKAHSSCRAGQCGTCKVAIRSGQVEYVSSPASMPEDGACLPCITRPTTNLVLDL